MATTGLTGHRSRMSKSGVLVWECIMRGRVVRGCGRVCAPWALWWSDRRTRMGPPRGRDRSQLATVPHSTDYWIHTGGSKPSDVTRALPPRSAGAVLLASHYHPVLLRTM